MAYLLPVGGRCPWTAGNRGPRSGLAKPVIILRTSFSTCPTSMMPTVSGADLHSPAKLVAGPLSGDVDGASHGVSPIERALRPLQHLDLLNVQERLVELVGACLEHPVDGNRHRRLVVADLGDAPYGQGGRAGGLRRHQCHVRHQGQVVARTPDPRILDVLALKRRHRDRNPSQALAAKPHGHDDLLNRQHQAAAARSVRPHPACCAHPALRPPITCSASPANAPARKTSPPRGQCAVAWAGGMIKHIHLQRFVVKHFRQRLGTSEQVPEAQMGLNGVMARRGGAPHNEPQRGQRAL